MDPALLADLDRLEREVARQRLNIFRSFAGRRVCLASPLLIDVCREGELDAAAWRLVPSLRWPLFIPVQATIRNPSATNRNLGFGAAPARDQVAGSVQETLVLRLTDRSAHLVLQVGGTSLRTSDWGGRLVLPRPLSQPERDRLVGGPLLRAFYHASIEGGDYVIRSAELDPGRPRTMIDFSAAPSEWRMPWHRPWKEGPF